MNTPSIQFHNPIPKHPKQKKEDIICRHGTLALELYPRHPEQSPSDEPFRAKVNGALRDLTSGETLILKAGERITLTPGIYHAFWPTSDNCIIGEVSTANDDTNDNFFVDPNIGRFPGITEDETALVRLVSEPD